MQAHTLLHKRVNLTLECMNKNPRPKDEIKKKQEMREENKNKPLGILRKFLAAKRETSQVKLYKIC